MALGNTNISVNAVRTELGLSPSVETDWLDLMGYAGINKFARYAPGALSVDATKSTVLTPPSSNVKIGDFRSYNHASNIPSVHGPSQANYNGAGNISIVVAALPEQMNVWEYADPADAFTFKIYKEIADRATEGSPLVVDSGDPIKALTYSTTVPPEGHTRSETKIVGSTQVSDSIEYSSVTNGFTTPNQNLYGDCFLCAPITGTRKINLGPTISGGYFSFIAHQEQLPYITASGNVTPPSGEGYTATWIEVVPTANTCDDDYDQTQTWSGTTFAFYTHIRGINAGDERVLAVSNCNIYLTHDGGKQLVYSGAMSHLSNTYISGTLQSGNTWSYDEIGYVTIENITWVAATYTTCP
jgi:hypothetical protein